MIRGERRQAARAEPRECRQRRLSSDHSPPRRMGFGPGEPDAGHLMHVEGEEQHADPRGRGEHEPPPGWRCRVPSAGVAHAQREQSQRHAQKAAIRSRQSRKEAPRGGCDAVVAAEVEPCPEGGQQEQRLRVRRAVEERERVGGEQPQRGTGARFVARDSLDARELDDRAAICFALLRRLVPRARRHAEFAGAVPARKS